MWLPLFLLHLPLLLAQSCPPIIGGNCYIFPPDDEINRPIDLDPVDYQSVCVINNIAAWDTGYFRVYLGDGADQPYGIPYVITNGSPLLPITYGTDGYSYQVGHLVVWINFMH